MDTRRQKIIELEEEKRVMLRCADLNPRETGSSCYMRRAVQCQKDIDALKRSLELAE